jgi:hypothetical protein
MSFFALLEARRREIGATWGSSPKPRAIGSVKHLTTPVAIAGEVYGRFEPWKLDFDAVMVRNGAGTSVRWERRCGTRRVVVSHPRRCSCTDDVIGADSLCSLRQCY